MIKHHRNLYVTLTEVLYQIFKENKYTDKVLESTFKKNKRYGKRDRAFVAEHTYEIIRWKRWIFTCGNIDLKKHKLWYVVATYFTLNDLELPNWEEFNYVNRNKILERAKKLKEFRAVRESFPDWLDELMVKELGEDIWGKEIQSLNIPAKAVLRANTLKTTPDEIIEVFGKRNIEAEKIQGYPDAVQLVEKRNVFTTDEFKLGWFEMQDANSQLVAPFSEVKPGMTVIDTCAGAGGKTLHLAALMENKGRIIATDLHQWKLNELKKRAKRNGAFNIETKIIDNKFIKRHVNSADRVVIDAPCTGLGVIKRNPDTKWKVSLEIIERMMVIQKEILHNYARMVKVGGKLIYITCSILPSENSNQIRIFTENNPSFKLEEEKSILTHDLGYDGFYMAKLIKIK